MDNLNQFLQPKDAPVSQERGYLPGTDFDSQYRIPPGAVNYTNTTISSRPYAAIVTISGEAGTFKDIQLAINYVHSYGGGTVFIRNGTYRMAASLLLFDNISLIGESNIQVIVDFNSSAFHIDTNGATFVLLKNIQIINCQSTTGAVYLNGGSSVTLDNVYFQSNTDSGGNDFDIYNNGTGSVTVTGCTSFLAGTFFHGTTNSSLFLINTLISTPKKYGLDGSLNGITLTGNLFYEFGISAISAGFSSSQIIGNNFFSDLNSAPIILLTSGVENQISSNHFRTTSTNKDVLKLQTSSFDNQIVGNFMVSNGSGKCVIFAAAADTANTLVGNRLNGGYTDNGSANVITGNS